MERRMAAYGKEDAWPLIGGRYADLFRRVVAREPLTDLLAIGPEVVAGARGAPERVQA
jgi:hypothetical protein